MMTSEVRDQLAQEDSALHRGLLQYARARVQAAERRWSQRHDAWREAETLYRTYRPPDAQDQRTKAQPLTEGVQKIIVPYSFSVVQSMVAFFMTILTERIPLIPVRGNGQKDVLPAQLMEEVLHWQLQTMDPAGILVIYQWLLDAHTYGLGVVKNLYTVREWVDIVRRFRQVVDPMTGVQTTIDELAEEDVIAYEGNEAMNVSPFDFLPDPGRPFAEFQRGEFVFHKMRRSRTEIAQKEAQGLYVGLQHLKDTSSYRHDGTGADGSHLADIAGMSTEDDGFLDRDVERKPYVTMHEGWCWIEPAQMAKWGLVPAQSAAPRTPRLWVLTLANMSRVLRAEPGNLPGRRFPFEIYETNYNVHSPANPGVIESISGLNYHMSWLFNSRMQSVRKTLNNEWLVDPSMVEMKDVEDPEPGKLIRLTRAAQNSGLIGQAILSMPVTDVTANHHTDSKIVQEIAEQVTGASRLLMGLPNTGRRSASEVQGQLSLSSGRMKMMAEVFATQGYRPLIHQMVRNTQVFMTESLNLRLREALADVVGAEALEIVPQMLQGDFTYPILEGGMPTDRMVEQNILREIIQTGMQTGAAGPLLQQLNWTALYRRFLEVIGIRNFSDYLVQVQPDQQVMDQQQAGNLIPTEPQVASDGYPQAPNMMAP